MLFTMLVRVDFYPRPLRGGRLPGDKARDIYIHISIHALCEEGDGCGGGKGHDAS